MLKKNQHKLKKVPQHLAIIMDGNRRWSKKYHLPRFAGHRAGLKTVEMVISESIKVGIKVLTLYAFSTENWKRSAKEINAIMSLFEESIMKQRNRLIENNIKVSFIGKRNNLSNSLLAKMIALENDTSSNSKLFLNIAINYGGRSEICYAFKKICQRIIKNSDKIKIADINEEIISKNLYTSNTIDPDLLIRTGGEKRISNFLLWQLAYTELWFTKTFWPEFSKENLYDALDDYQKRVRKFGGEV